MEQDVPWDEIARAWCDLSTPIAAIAERFGVTLGQLRRVAGDNDWPTREALRQRRGAVPANKKSRAGAKSPAAEKASAKTIKPLGLVKRIYNTIDKELNKLEEHAGASSQDRERASRALSQMVSSLEKAVEMQREMTREQGRKDTSGKDKEALKHAEDLRREIADRLERIQRKRSADK